MNKDQISHSTKNRFSPLADDETPTSLKKSVAQQGKRNTSIRQKLPPRSQANPDKEFSSEDSTGAIKKSDNTSTGSQSETTDGNRIENNCADDEENMDEDPLEEDGQEEEMEGVANNETQEESNAEPAPPIVIELTTHTPSPGEEDSDGEAACSGDERSPPKKNLQDIFPTPSVASTSSNTALSSLSQSTDPSLMIDPNSGQHLITAEIQLQPEKEHLEVLLSETERLLEYAQELDPSATFVSRGPDKDNKPLPDLTSPTDKHWPTKFASAQNWFQIPAGYIFSQPPISKKNNYRCV
jgi:hypothetical protein